MNKSNLKIKINGKKFIIYNLFIILLLIILDIVSRNLYVNGIASEKTISIFFINDESNIPTFFSSITLLLSSLLLFIISIISQNNRKRFWRILSGIFLFLSIDEVSMIHERIYRISYLLNQLIKTPIVWYAPYLLIVFVIFITLFRDINKLPVKTKFLFYISGLIYISGSIIFEHIGNNCLLIFSSCKELINLFIIFEEGMEMLGITIFNYALINYISEHTGILLISITNHEKKNQKPRLNM